MANDATKGGAGVNLRPKLVVSDAEPIKAAPAVADPIAHYIDLEIEARQLADLDSLRFSIVNSTRRIAHFEQAYLVEPKFSGGYQITLASGVSSVDHSTPLLRGLAHWLSHPKHKLLIERGEPRQVNLREEGAEWQLELNDVAPPNAFWLPLKSRDGQILAALLALKGEAWLPQHIALMLPLAGAYGHAWEALLPRKSPAISRQVRLVSKKSAAVAFGIISSLVVFIPVPISALAPAEVVAASPHLVTAPMEGVIGDILIPSGSWVEKNTPVVKLVDIKLRNDLEIANRNVAVAEARHFKVVQTATAAVKDMQELATAKAELEVATAELDYAAEALRMTEIRAVASGFLIYSGKSDWLGKPVATGERIMEIGNPEKTEIRIELPVSDAIVLEAGNGVALFLDGDPLNSIPGKVSRISYRPQTSAEQQLVYKIYASFNEPGPHRIGLRGVARVSGEKRPLWFYLLRRPLAALRQRFGL